MDEARELIRLTGYDGYSKGLIIDIDSNKGFVRFMPALGSPVYYKLISNYDGTYQITNQNITFEMWLSRMMG
jgi:hypothetical protein